MPCRGCRWVLRVVDCHPDRARGVIITAHSLGYLVIPLSPHVLLGEGHEWEEIGLFHIIPQAPRWLCFSFCVFLATRGPSAVAAGMVCSYQEHSTNLSLGGKQNIPLV